MNKMIYALALALLIVPNIVSAQKNVSRKEYKLVWKDDFKSQELDTTIWQYRSLGPRRASINAVEAIVPNRRKGHLHIRTFAQDGNIITGMLRSKAHLDQQYGYFECRFKVDEVFRGYWPAFWLQSNTFGSTKTPADDGVEIDVMEFYLGDPKLLENALHWNGYGADHKSVSQKTPIPNIADGKFHIAAVEWTPEYYKFYFDGKLVWTATSPISHRPQYVILSTEVDSKQVFINKMGDSFLDFTVDYVRVYQKKSK
ncbi:glycoside hydrolase family 16 protein [Sphingobacterium wenxiniae]|nr:glycoside hydrolase family 16 protein [Sphingobacterium wenxiniae]